jgi:hypothetical protein
MTARLLFLLLSPDFFASEMGQQRLQMALRRQQRSEARVIPVLVRPCAWEHTQLKPFQILPRNHRAITQKSNWDELWQEIVIEVSNILDSLHQLIYVIFAPEDQEIAERLSQDMAHAGVTIWSPNGGHLSQDLSQEREAMRQASSVLLLASTAAFSSRVVRTQTELASVYQRPLQVIWVSGEDGEREVLGRWQGGDLLDARAEHYETAKESLLAHITQALEVVPTLEELPQPVGEPRNPYKGLQSFTAEDILDFFGREALIDELATAVEQILVQEKKSQPNERLLAILGASGSGKSSVVRAGLLPHLQQGGVFDSREWIYLDPIVPGTHPLEELALSLAGQPALGNVASLHRELESDSLRTLHLLARQLVTSSPQKVVLFIDQFEEVFPLTISEEERQHFFDLVITAATEPQGPLLVILTMRLDFSERAIEYPALYRLQEAHHVPLLRMERDDLRRVIQEPARLPDVQMTFEDDLVGDLLFDMREQVGALPLLEFTLDLLFAHRNGHMLTLHAYHEIGGVKGALARHAEATYAALPTKEHQMLARSLFLRLIDPGHSEQDTTRRRAKLTEFEQFDLVQTKLLRETIDAFVAARLLTTNERSGEATLEVSHEALIREWLRLIEWLHETREDILLQQKISEDAAEWQQYRCPQDRLYRGSQLKEARAWVKRNTPSRLEGAFLHSSMKQHVQFVVSMIGVMLVLFATTGTAIYFFMQRSPDPTKVTTLQNDGVGSLRWAVDNALSGKTITFASSLAGQTLTLTDTLVFPNKQLSIQGPDGRRITVRCAKHEIVVDNQASITLVNLAFLGSPDNLTSLFRNQGTLRLTSSTVSSNTVKGDSGGGIFNKRTLVLTNSTVSGNTASSGGGIVNDGGAVTLTNSTVSGNTASSGGGISNYINGTVTLTNSTVSDNTADGNGGGGISNGGNLTLANSTIEGNTSKGLNGGGGISNEGTATLMNSTVSDNTASDTTGGGISNEGTVTLMNSTVSSNTAAGSGGGIAGDGGKVILVFCTLYGNRANTGGGLATQAGMLGLANSVPGVSIVRNSLVAGNQASTDPDVAGELTTEGYNLMQSAAGTVFLDPDHQHSTDLTNIPLSALKIDPSLQLNRSKTTKTHALLSGSPAIEMIPLEACHPTVNDVLITADQRGIKRPQEAKCDIGAYEYIP